MISAPKNPLPWTRRVELGPFYDANGVVVPGVDNLAYLAGVAEAFPQLVARLGAMTDAYELAAGSAGVAEADIAAIAAPARALLRACEVDEPKAETAKPAAQAGAA